MCMREALIQKRRDAYLILESIATVSDLVVLLLRISDQPEKQNQICWKFGFSCLSRERSREKYNDMVYIRYIKETIDEPQQRE